jgi:hypothetical protein
MDEFRELRIRVANLLTQRHVKPIYFEMLEKPSSLTPEQFYITYLGECQLYLGIFGERDTLPTEKEYREAVIAGLQRWVFIKEANQRGQQISALITLAEKEIVRAKFTTNDDLLTKVDERIQNYLSESTREYIELRKRRTQEFLADYRRNFLEPLLEQVQVVRSELENRQSIMYGNYWDPTKITNHPYFHVDQELKSGLQSFFNAFQHCAVNTEALAVRAFQEENCKGMTLRFIGDYVKGMPKDAQGRVFDQVESALYQSSLMYYDDLSYLKDDDLTRMIDILKNRLASALSDPNIILSYNVHRDLGELVKGIVLLNQKNDSIRRYMAARSELEKASNLAHELLWKRFVDSTGYLPTL